MSNNSVKNIFVFVVCGDDKHINTLNFSIKYLRFFSKNKIIVVTDLKRNTLKIEHDHVIDIPTPQDYDHHQASIWLKTGLHLLLSPDNNYCYLDSDVIALSSEVDDIFKYKNGPVTFAADHCVLKLFSPTAINCGCIEDFNKRKQNFYNTFQSLIPWYNYEDNYNNPEARIVSGSIKNALSNPLLNLVFIFKIIIKGFIPENSFLRISPGIHYSKKLKAWVNDNNKIISFDLFAFNRIIKRKSDFFFSYFRLKWFQKGTGEVFDTKGCRHLIEKVKEKFNITIKTNNWQHWNGGVFLFDSGSAEFMDTWHNMTVEILKDPEWKTRDQGTLAATVWKMGLQKQKCLPEKLNFLADFNNPQITAYINSGVLIAKKGSKSFQPAFIHVYHKFGYHGWDVWDAIEEINPDRSK